MSIENEIKKLEELKQSRCSKCSENKNSNDMWCWHVPWFYCDVKNLRNKIEKQLEQYKRLE